MSSWLVYLWTRADVIINISSGLALLFGIGIVLLGIWFIVEESNGFDDESRLLKKVFKRILPMFILCMIIGIVVPSKKDIAMIYVIPKMANSQTFKELSDSTPEITKLALEALKETLQDMTKKESK